MTTGLHAKLGQTDPRKLTNIALAASLGLLFATSAQAEVGISANIELDTDAVQNRGGGDDDDFDQGGRIKVSIFGDHNINDTTVVSAVGQLLIKKDGDTGVDDAYIRLGREMWGVRFGRWEAIDLFSKGTDTILNVIGDTANYQANAARGRISDAGQIGLELFPSDRVFITLDTVYGETDPDEGSSSDEDIIAGFRPAIQVDLTDDLRLTAGLDYLEDGDSETKGGGIYLRYATDAFALKLNYAQGEKETNDITDWDNTTYNVNIEFGNIGLGYQRSEDDSGDEADTIYGRYLFRDLMGNESANAQLGFSVGQADSVEETEYALRLRFFYEF